MMPNDPLIQFSKTGVSADQERTKVKKKKPWICGQTSSLAHQIKLHLYQVGARALMQRYQLVSQVKPKSYTFLDPGNGNGLKVDYTFLSEVSTVSPLHVCVQVLVENSSTEPILETNL